MAVIMISGGIVITMDPQRKIIDDGAVVIKNRYIIDIGKKKDLEKKFSPDKFIDSRNKVVMPGLIDGHGHAGHGLVKTIGSKSEIWYKACEKIYAEGSTEEFWYAEALLTGLERLKFGTTCGVTFLGGADSVMRTDDPVFGYRHCEAIKKLGIREFLAVGPRRPPFPRKYCRWSGNVRRDVMISFEDYLKNSENIIRHWHGKAEGRINICMMFPTPKQDREPMSPNDIPHIIEHAQAARDLSKKYNVMFLQDGHKTGTIEFAHEQLEVLGSDVLLSHCTDLTPNDIRILKLTDTKVVHNPSARASISGRCPVPELIDSGVTVMLGSDGTAPDRSYDMFRHMFHTMHYNRTYYHDTNYMPPGKVLEMATIDGARSLGLDNELGSLEPGKKADIIIVDIFKPHIYPLNMPVSRITYYANGNDVDTVIVDGQILMENRIVNTVNETEILQMAQHETELMLDRTKLRHLLLPPTNFWKNSKY